jgi:hypothetical protein
MKKYLIPIIILCVAGAGVFIRYIVVSPARALARDLEAINGITVGQTTEADLLRRNAFQTVDPACSQGMCIYSTDRENSFLSMLHLAPRTIVSTTIVVVDGVVIQVFTAISRQGLFPVSVAQATKLPAGCVASPCLKQPLPLDKYLRSISIVFSNESELRNRWPQILDTACLSRLHGCATYAELVPLAKELNLEAAAH